ncbi:hypothetical protein JOF56_010738 [Kibdelosporangium banguiense]|uniref:N-acetyltransferase domain-containing protein n=1 Tax=Kibdelosporangium banguiense TaxID=1365924 RepID=A0ABS4U2A5_9PSEU|nr:hypothetical protein [Kibdelosporangium banguiense]
MQAGLANLLEQSERQSIISDALKAPDGRQVLAIVAGDPARLEAVCLWQVVTATDKPKSSDQDIATWNKGWKSMYISELTSAPWNVGWPTGQTGVNGAARALIEAAKAKAVKEGFDGIGLTGLLNNLDFYRKVGFKARDGGLAMVMNLK